MPRVTTQEGDLRYPELPRRESVLKNPDLITMPWELSAEQLIELPENEIAEGLKIMKQVYRDYTSLIEEFAKATEKCNRANQKIEEISARAARIKEEYDSLVAELTTTRRRLERSEKTIDRLQAGGEVTTKERERRTIKMPIPPTLTDGQDPTYNDWYISITDVLEANADHYRNEKLRMTFLAGCTGGRARQ